MAPEYIINNLATLVYRGGGQKYRSAWHVVCHVEYLTIIMNPVSRTLFFSHNLIISFDAISMTSQP